MSIWLRGREAKTCTKSSKRCRTSPSHRPTSLKEPSPVCRWSMTTSSRRPSTRGKPRRRRRSSIRSVRPAKRTSSQSWGSSRLRKSNLSLIIGSILKTPMVFWRSVLSFSSRPSKKTLTSWNFCHTLRIQNCWTTVNWKSTHWSSLSRSATVSSIWVTWSHKLRAWNSLGSSWWILASSRSSTNR